MSMDEAEDTLAKCCMTFLSLQDFENARSSLDEQRETWEDSGLANMEIWEDDQTEPSETNKQLSDHRPQDLQTPFLHYAASP